MKTAFKITSIFYNLNIHILYTYMLRIMYYIQTSANETLIYIS